MVITVHHSRSSVQSGFSLIELMVALVIGFVILLALSAVFYTSTVSRKETDRAARQIENGRYAMQVLADDLRLAGYYAEFNSSLLTATPAVKPDPCLTTVADLNAALPLHIQGYDNPTVATIPTCVSDWKVGTDIVVVRRTETCIRGAANCEGAANDGWAYFQAALCADVGSTELASATVTDYFALDTDETKFNKHKRNCTAGAEIRRYRTEIYFIANNDVGTDGIPTLKRAELRNGTFTIVPMVEGIENLQMEYGVDTNGDGSPDTFTANPDAFTYALCGTAPCMSTWRDVVSVRVNILARNTEVSPAFTDTRVYTLGKKADGTDNTFGAFNDAIKRHAYDGQVRINNVSARRLVP